MIHISEKPILLAGVPSLTDFGLDAYATLELETNLVRETELEIVLGEVLAPGGAINREPGGFRTVRSMRKHCPAGKYRFRFELPQHKSPYLHTVSIPVPAEAEGEIVPFRYVEISGGEGRAVLRRHEFFPEFNDEAAHFECSDAGLNRIWDFCKYTMKATGVFGIYIDGERERKPYEGDAYINQLGHFCCDANYMIARDTIDYLLEHPTWPTEWHLLMPLVVRDYLLYSGDAASAGRWRPALKERTLLHHAGDDLLIREQNDIRDIVDWPQCERDNYEFGQVNLVPNCYHHQALSVMYELSGDDFYRRRAAQVREAIRRTMLKNGVFVDNPESSHVSLHGAMFAMLFDIAGPDEIPALTAILRARGMACSVYGAQFLLETCYKWDMADHALNLMTATGLRSWHNMLDKGATITMEAWDDSLKPNQDWNHAWGAAPANIVTRELCGIKPTAPGFTAFQVRPQPGGLTSFNMRQPTIHGAIELEYRNGGYLLTVPRNCTGTFNAREYGPGTHRL
jgi:hypothetical protein